MRGWIYRFAGVVACGVACVVGLSARLAFALDQGQVFAQCASQQAAQLAQVASRSGCSDPTGTYHPWQTVLGCTTGPLTTPFACGSSEVCGQMEQVNCNAQHLGYSNFKTSFSGRCTARPAQQGPFKGDGGPKCDSGCNMTQHCSGQVCNVDFGNGQAWAYGTYAPDGTTCASGSPPPPPDNDPPCDSVTGICFYPSGPKYCAQTEDGVVCVPSPRPTHGPDCGTGATSAVCAGTPSDPTAPPPTPPNPPIQPNTPPDININITQTGPSGPPGPITINVTNNNNSGGGGGGGDPGGGGGNGGGSGDGGAGSGGDLCPDGTHPDGSGNCPATHGNCPDGSPPVNGQCGANPGGCADGTQPVNGTCGGTGNCSNGQPPVDGQCPATCPDGSAPVNGQCTAPWQNCQNGQPPVNGQCPAGTCNPQTDPNHCDNGYANGGESCGAAPACNGDQIACASLFQIWKTRCAISGTADPPVDPFADAAQDAATVWGADQTVGSDQPWWDDSGFGLPRTCPTVPSITVLDTTVDIPPVWCGLLTMMGTLLVIGASWVAVKIAGTA